MDIIQDAIRRLCQLAIQWPKRSEQHKTLNHATSSWPLNVLQQAFHCVDFYLLKISSLVQEASIPLTKSSIFSTLSAELTNDLDPFATADRYTSCMRWTLQKPSVCSRACRYHR